MPACYRLTFTCC